MLRLKNAFLRLCGSALLLALATFSRAADAHASIVPVWTAYGHYIYLVMADGPAAATAIANSSNVLGIIGTAETVAEAQQMAANFGQSGLLEKAVHPEGIKPPPGVATNTAGELFLKGGLYVVVVAELFVLGTEVYSINVNANTIQQSTNAGLNPFNGMSNSEIDRFFDEMSPWTWAYWQSYKGNATAAIAGAF